MSGRRIVARHALEFPLCTCPRACMDDAEPESGHRDVVSTDPATPAYLSYLLKQSASQLSDSGPSSNRKSKRTMRRQRRAEAIFKDIFKQQGHDDAPAVDNPSPSRPPSPRSLSRQAFSCWRNERRCSVSLNFTNASFNFTNAGWKTSTANSSQSRKCFPASCSPMAL